MGTHELKSAVLDELRFDAAATPREQFIRRCASLFREHNGDLLALLSAKLHSWSEAKDVAQEAYVRIFQLKDFAAIGHLRGLLSRPQ